MNRNLRRSSLRRTASLTSERGQAFVLTAIMLASLLGMAAFVLDVGSWFRSHRQTQVVADAAALAGAQALPEDTGQAYNLALEYANDKNEGSVTGSDITFSSAVMANDTITVHARDSAPSFFAKLLGIDSVDVGATAKARASNLGSARWASPFGIDKRQPEISGSGCPCYGSSATLDIFKVGPGSFKLINVDGSHGGTGPGTLADWILRGYEGYMPLDWYFSDAGAKFNSVQVRDALDERLGSTLLFPVYDDVQGGGANLEYRVVGWAAFELTGYQMKGSCNKQNQCTITGTFKKIVWEGLGSESPDNYFGVTTVALAE